MKIIEKEFNVQTGEETIIERELTKQEIAEIKEAQAKAEALAAEASAKEAARAALLERLGITEEEAKLLLG